EHSLVRRFDPVKHGVDIRLQSAAPAPDDESDMLTIAYLNGFDAGKKAAPAQDAWHDAVLQQCMAVEGCYVPNDPTTTLSNLINWHVLNERDAAPAQTVAKTQPAFEAEQARFEKWVSDSGRAHMLEK